MAAVKVTPGLSPEIGKVPFAKMTSAITALTKT
jgi:hypothetical protein